MESIESSSTVIFTSVVFSFVCHRTPKEVTALRKNHARSLSEVERVRLRGSMSDIRD